MTNDAAPGTNSIPDAAMGPMASAPPELRDELWQVTAHLDLVLDSLRDHAIITLDRDGRITSWNRAAAAMKGYTGAEAIGMSFARFYSLEDQANGLPMRLLAAAAADGRNEVEGWRMRKDGTRFWASVVIQPLTDRAGQLRGYVKVTRDISQKQQIERLQEELHQSQKLEVLGQLTGGIAHDFNNFLTTMEISFDLIRRYADDERIARVLDINRVALERSSKLTGQLLTFARKQVLHPKISNINELVYIFDLILQKAVGEAISFRLTLEPDLPSTLVDQAQFQSALLNLVVNARDAMPHGGTLTIFSELTTLGEENFPAPFTVRAGNYVTLGVSDTGTGMPGWVQEHAIEPFFTTKDVGKGTGLGLSQCFGFARQAGGTLTIESREGLGTTVRLLLPVLQPEGAVEEVPQERTVLLVDDDATVRSLLAESLRMIGHRVIEAEDAYSALEHLHRNVDIDFLFTDVIMPKGFHGVKLVAEARKIRPGLKALLASGYTRDMLRDTAELPDDVAFLEKPYRTFDIVALLQRPSESPSGVVRSRG